MTDIRLTREAVEVVSNLTTTPEVRVTRRVLEVLTSAAATEPPVAQGGVVLINVTYLYEE